MSTSTTQFTHETSKHNSEAYSASSIKVYRGLDAVRKRPGMYIGDINDGTGLHHMVYEVVDNSIDEALAGHCSKIDVTIHADESVSVQDNGRGIPVDLHEEEGRSAAEVIMTVLHAGGKFDSNSYKVSGGLHGLGVSLVNALSEKLILVICRGGHRYEQSYQYGKPVEPLKCVGDSEERGTWIQFLPDKGIFKQNRTFYYETLLKRFRELAFLTKVSISLKDEREEGKEAHLDYRGGIVEFVEYLNKGEPCILSKPLYISGERQGVEVEIALNWQESFSKEELYCFTNMIPQRDGGEHLKGFKFGLTRALNQYLEKEGFLKRFKVDVIGEDFQEALLSVLSIKVADPLFNSQTKEKLVSSEVRGIVRGIVYEKLMNFFLENPNEAKAVCIKVIKAGQARSAMMQAKLQVARKTPLNNNLGVLLEGLTDCRETNPALCELFLVEGRSAGGPVKQARNRRFQAVLPLRGKILNIERIGFDKMLASKAIATLVAALGCGIGVNYNIEKLRYHHIIIMTDADVDGAHIRTLLLTFFYRHFPEVIEKGYLYIAHPPLYKLRKGKQEVYLQDDEALEKWLADHVLENAALFAEGEDEQLVTKQALEGLVADYRQIKIRLQSWEKHYPSTCLASLLELPLVSIETLSDVEHAKEFCDQWQAVLDKRMGEDIYYRVDPYVEKTELGTEGLEALQEPLYLPHIREWRYSVEKSYYFTRQFFQSDAYQELVRFSRHLAELTRKALVIKQGEHTKTTFSFYDLYSWLMEEAGRGYTVQRYKGLGEMNWQELLPVVDAKTRQLSRVAVEDAIEAEQVLTILMGNDVGSRHQFIEQNALDVTDIDV